MRCIVPAAVAAALASSAAVAQVPPATKPELRAIATAPSAARIEADIRTLVGFGTRHTLSDTKSETRGIGAARRWIVAEFARISRECGGCLDVRYSSGVIQGETRIPNARPTSSAGKSRSPARSTAQAGCWCSHPAGPCCSPRGCPRW